MRIPCRRPAWSMRSSSSMIGCGDATGDRRLGCPKCRLLVDVRANVDSQVATGQSSERVRGWQPALCRWRNLRCKRRCEGWGAGVAWTGIPFD